MKRLFLLMGIIFVVASMVALKIRTNILFITSTALFAAGVFFLGGKTLKSKIIKIILLTVSFNFLFMGIYSLNIIKPYEKLIGKNISVEGVVTESYTMYGSYFIECKVKLPEVTGVPKSTYMKISSYNSMDLEIGDVFRGKVSVTLPDNYKIIERNYHNNIMLSGNAVSYFDLIEETPLKLTLYAAKAKKYIIENINKYTNYKISPLIIAIITGDRNAMNRDLLGYLSRSGVMHMVAVSGMHMAIIANIFLKIFMKMQIGKVLPYYFTLPFIWGFAFICGFSPSVIRSAIMISIAYIGKAIFHKDDMLNSLGIAAIITLIINPYMVMNVGFQMSYLAMIGIATFGTKMEKDFYERFDDAEYHFVPILTTSISAWLIVIPISAVTFGYLSLLSPITNLILTPFVPIIMILGFIIGALPTFIPTIIGFFIGKIADAIAVIIVFITGTISKLPFSIIMIDENWKILWVIFSAFLLISVTFIKNNKNIIRFSLLSIIFVFVGGTLVSKILQINSYELICNEDILYIKDNHKAIIININDDFYNDYHIQNPLDNIKDIEILFSDNYNVINNHIVFDISKNHNIKKLITDEKIYNNEIKFDEIISLKTFAKAIYNDIIIEKKECGCFNIKINEINILKKSENCDIIEPYENYHIITDSENKIHFINNGKFIHKNKAYWESIYFY